ncbi:MAG TPA: NAD-dependent epimerase/dehydratase family protein [Bacillales bacterium]|nr:NAD-dependent epimerase/dehydratase family protein [Bacillales bacterium]
MKILVLGGTRFFGKRLVENLINHGDQVTIGTRGQTKDPFGNKVNRVQLDRFDQDSLKAAVGSESWDVVYDQICYSPNDALNACEVFGGKVDRYIFTSSMSVYDLSEVPIKEEAYDPYTYPVEKGDRDQFSYSEGKRLAEAVFFQHADFPVTAVRIPIVMGTDDYTERLLFHIERVKDGRSLGMPNKEAKLSFISSEEAADFLEWAGKSELNRPVNACADGDISLDELLGLIEEAVGRKAIVKEEAVEEDRSPYGIPSSWIMNNTKAKEAGYVFTSLRDWLPGLIRELA